ncbi:MAG: ADOP family duplicated permease [Pseudomonas sp.]
MSFLDAVRYRMRSLFRAAEAEREREEEFAFHRSLSEQELVSGEVNGKEARHAARRAFGNATYVKEEIRQMGALRWIDALGQDLRFGARTLRRSPVFTLVAVLSIGLGIGANTAIFGMMHALLFARLPIAAPRELMLVQRVQPSDARSASGWEGPTYFSWEEYQALSASRGIALSSFAGSYSDHADINASAKMSVSIKLVDGSFFPLLGIGTAAGRLLTSADQEQARPVAVVSYNFAVHHYSSAGGAVGQTIKLHGNPFAIVGVLPREFLGLVVAAPDELVVPRSTFALFRDREAGQQRPPMRVIGRVPAGASGALAALDATFRNCCAQGQLADRYTEHSPGPHVMLADMSRGVPQDKKDIRAQYAQAFIALMSGVALLLLIACTNVGNLLLARAVLRSRELSVRLSLGASRGRVVRQLLVESGLLAALGAALGVILALWGSALLARHLPVNLRMLQPFIAVRPSLLIFAFAIAVTIGCALLFGVLPALRATRLDLIARLREVRPTVTRGRLDRAIVALQVGLALVLASSAGLLVATLRNVGSSARMLEPDRLLMAYIDVAGIPNRPRALRPVYDQIAERIRQVPGVRSVASTSVPPFALMGPTRGRSLDIPGHEAVDNREMIAGIVSVTPGYFDALSIALKAGREFTSEDKEGAERATIISESFAREFFAARYPIGDVIRFRNDSTPPWRIIGVAEDVKYYDLRAPAPRTMYMPWAQVGDLDWTEIHLLIRTDGKAAAWAVPIRNAITSSAPGVSIRRLGPVTEDAAYLLGREKSLAWLSVAFGTLAVLLAAVGLYGVMAFQVSARSREIGVRIALGADATRVVQMVLRQSLVVVVIGVVFGVPLALAAARGMAALLYGVPPWHPAPLAGAALLLLVVGMLASLLPSRNAARVDPMVAIRSD